MKAEYPRPNEPLDRPMFWEHSVAFLRWAVALILGSCAAYLIVLYIVAPEQMWSARAAGPVVLSLLAAAAFVLQSRGRIEASVYVLCAGLWAYATGMSLLFGGLNSAMILAYPLIIIGVGWLLGSGTAVALAALTAVVCFGFFQAELRGFLPPRPPTSPALLWVVQTTVLAFSALLITYLVRSYRNRLAEVRKLGSDLALRTAEVQAREADLNRAQAVAHVGSWVYDLAVDTIRMSAETCRIFGLPEGTTGSHESYLARVHPEDRAAVDVAWQAALKGGEPFDNEHRILVGTTIRWVRQMAELGFDADGTPLRCVGTTQDITEGKKVGEALRESEARFRSLTELSSDWYWEQDAQFRFTSLVGKVSSKTGIRAEDHLGKTRWDLPAINLSDADWTEHRALLERHQPFYGFEVQRPDADGRQHWASTSGEPLFDEAGRFEGYRGVGTDITERKLAEQALANINTELDARVKSRTAELEHANEALQRSNMELQRFAYVASHDLKTPLRSISSFAELLQKSLSGKLDAQSDDWMRRIVASSQRMERMLQDALAYAQIDSRAQPFEHVELSEACQAALGWLGESIQGSGAQISCGALPAALGDERQLTQLFQNLIGNAIMYCGERAPKIEISARREADQHVISVSDLGIGIEARHQQRIFDMFYRLHSREAYPGTGIGLAVCQRIVHRHRGRIRVESEPGKGSTFSFTLPMMDNSRDAPR